MAHQWAMAHRLKTNGLEAIKENPDGKMANLHPMGKIGLNTVTITERVSLICFAYALGVARFAACLQLVQHS